MSIRVGDKTIRSLPEQVSELTKEVEMIKDIKLHYVHAIVFYSGDDKVMGSTFVVSDRSSQYAADTLLQYLHDKGFDEDTGMFYPASGCDDDGAGPICAIQVNDTLDAINVYSGSVDAGSTEHTISLIQDVVISLF